MGDKKTSGRRVTGGFSYLRWSRIELKEETAQHADINWANPVPHRMVNSIRRFREEKKKAGFDEEKATIVKNTSWYLNQFLRKYLWSGIFFITIPFFTIKKAADTNCEDPTTWQTEWRTKVTCWNKNHLTWRVTWPSEIHNTERRRPAYDEITFTF